MSSSFLLMVDLVKKGKHSSSKQYFPQLFLFSLGQTMRGVVPWVQSETKLSQACVTGKIQPISFYPVSQALMSKVTTKWVWQIFFYPWALVSPIPSRLKISPKEKKKKNNSPKGESVRLYWAHPFSEIFPSKYHKTVRFQSAFWMSH